MRQVNAYLALNYEVGDYKYLFASVRQENEKYGTRAIYNKKYLDPATMLYTQSLKHDNRLVVDMPLAMAGQSSSSLGWKRDSVYYKNELLQQCPEAFSEINKTQPGMVADEQFVQVFPQYKDFLGQKLVHHHIGEGRQAVYIPESLHVGPVGIHNAEKEAGIFEAAKLESDFCKGLYKSDPDITNEQLDKRFSDYVKENQIKVGMQENHSNLMSNEIWEKGQRLKETWNKMDRNDDIKKLQELKVQLSNNPILGETDNVEQILARGLGKSTYTKPVEDQSNNEDAEYLDSLMHSIENYPKDKQQEFLNNYWGNYDSDLSARENFQRMFQRQTQGVQNSEPDLENPSEMQNLSGPEELENTDETMDSLAEDTGEEEASSESKELDNDEDETMDSLAEDTGEEEASSESEELDNDEDETMDSLAEDTGEEEASSESEELDNDEDETMDSLAEDTGEEEASSESEELDNDEDETMDSLIEDESLGSSMDEVGESEDLSEGFDEGMSMD
ncbi:hypothetical protein [Holdemania filiformis]|uniref:hypothetical protein n=4 Tax=Holdemania filiformis TaxID=61171 RepID=UPI0011C148AA|nr:hypothetical protein [Holdemania filiformis]